ncbi:hypothetical protein FOZ61_007881 [Perkinsus olseni]|nr:hypothetical protein FOZ61_007881 [Perkinsus olseni]
MTNLAPRVRPAFAKLPAVADLRRQRLSLNDILLTAQVAGEHLRSTAAIDKNAVEVRWPREFLDFSCKEAGLDVGEVVSLARALADTGPASNFEPLARWFMQRSEEGRWSIRELALLSAGVVCDTRDNRDHDVGEVLEQFLVEVARVALRRTREVAMAEDKDIARLLNSLSKYPRNGRHFEVIRNVFGTCMARVCQLCQAGLMSPMSLSLIVNGMGKVMIPVTTPEVRNSLRVIQNYIVVSLQRVEKGWDKTMDPKCVPNLLNGFCKMGSLDRQFLSKLEVRNLPMLKDSHHVAVLLHTFVKAGGRDLLTQYWREYLSTCIDQCGPWETAQAASCSLAHGAALGLRTDVLPTRCEGWIKHFDMVECLLVVDHLPPGMLAHVLRRATQVEGTFAELSDFLWTLSQRRAAGSEVDILTTKCLNGNSTGEIREFGRLAKLARATATLGAEETGRVIDECVAVVEELGPSPFGSVGLHNILHAMTLHQGDNLKHIARILNYVAESGVIKGSLSEDFWMACQVFALDCSGSLSLMALKNMVAVRDLRLRQPNVGSAKCDAELYHEIERALGGVLTHRSLGPAWLLHLAPCRWSAAQHYRCRGPRNIEFQEDISCEGHLVPPPIPCCADGDDEKYKYKLVETAAFEDHEEAVGSIPASDAFIRISAHVDDIHFGHDRLRPFFMVPEGRALARMYENLAEGRESLAEGALKPLQLVVERDRLMALDGNRRLAVLKALHCRHPEMFDGWLDDCHVLTKPSPPRVKRKITTSPMIDGRTVRFEFNWPDQSGPDVSRLVGGGAHSRVSEEVPYWARDLYFINKGPAFIKGMLLEEVTG